jgi:hypothetical protein
LPFDLENKMEQEKSDATTERPVELPPPELVTREELRQHLIKIGYPITAGTLNQLCAPSRNEGPPVAGYWGARAVYRLKDGLAWAHARLQHKPYRVHPAYGRRKQSAAASFAQ